MYLVGDNPSLSACTLYNKNAFKKFIFLALFIDNGNNEEKGSNVELNTYSYAKQIPGCNRAYYYEEVQETNSHQSGSYVNEASHEGIEMTTNIVYALTRKIETKTNVAYATTGRLHQT